MQHFLDYLLKPIPTFIVAKFLMQKKALEMLEVGSTEFNTVTVGVSSHNFDVYLRSSTRSMTHKN